MKWTIIDSTGRERLEIEAETRIEAEETAAGLSRHEVFGVRPRQGDSLRSRILHQANPDFKQFPP